MESFLGLSRSKLLILLEPIYLYINFIDLCTHKAHEVDLIVFEGLYKLVSGPQLLGINPEQQDKTNKCEQNNSK